MPRRASSSPTSPATPKRCKTTSHRTPTGTNCFDKVASGPPLYSPLKLLDPVANVAEMFIHHEDVRRAQPGWEPRVLESALAGSLRRTLPLMGRLTLAKVPGRVALRRTDGRRS